MVILPKIERIDTGNGRFYKTPEGNYYPSVTSILSSQDNEYLNQWRKAVGEEEANKVSRRAAARGSRIHKYVEEHLTGNIVKCSSIFDQVMFDSLLPVLSSIDNIRTIEGSVYSDYLKVAGTIDLVADFDNKRSVIDWKSSSKLKYKSQISSYFMQAAAYAVCWEEITKQPIAQLVIVLIIESDQSYVFIEHRDNWIDQFIDLRKKFKNEFIQHN
jgi:genome maintenance exonuclease 1